MEELVCVICGERVSKRKSFAYRTGRACKHHPEAVEGARLRAEQADAERKAVVDRQNRRFRPPQPVSLPEPRMACWHCGVEGMTGRDHHVTMLMAVEKVTLAGGNVLDTKQVLEAYKTFNPKPVLMALEVPRDHPIIKNTPNGNMLWLVVGGQFIMCPSCAKQYNLSKEFEAKLYPPVNAEKVQKLAAAMSINL